MNIFSSQAAVSIFPSQVAVNFFAKVKFEAEDVELPYLPYRALKLLAEPPPLPDEGSRRAAEAG